LKSIIVCQYQHSVGGLWENPANLHACHVVNSNNAINSLPTLQISLGIVAIFEKIYYDGEPIFTIFPNIGEGLQHQCFSNVRSVPQPDINAALGNNYCLQVLETWFAEQF
jgi:hypothetical protein